jgi:hypothetical protein
MVDTCRIQRVTGTTTDPVTGVVSSTYGTVYEGRCKIQRFRGTFPSNPAAGEHSWTVAPIELHVPVAGTAAIGTGDLVVVTASFDPLNVGREFRVRTHDRKSLQSALRLAVEEVVG